MEQWGSRGSTDVFLQQLQRQISPARGRRQPCLQLHLHASRDARRGHSSLCRVEAYHCPQPSALRGSETEKEFHKNRIMPHTGWTSYCVAWTLIPHGFLLSEAIHGEAPPPIFQRQTKSSAHTGTWICNRDNSFWVSDQHCCLPLLLHTCNYLSKTPVFLKDFLGLGEGIEGGPLLCGNWGSSCLDHMKDDNLITRCFLFALNWHITSTNVHYKRWLMEPRAFKLETGPAWCPPLPFTSARSKEAAPARVQIS